MSPGGRTEGAGCRVDAVRRIAVALAVAAFVATLVMVGWYAGSGGGTTTLAVSSTTTAGATTAVSSATSSTTATGVPTAALTPVPAEDVVATGFSPLLALSSTEAWAVVNTHEDFACVVGHLRDGTWAYWRLDDGSRIRDLAVAPNGTLWLAGDAGIFRFDGGQWVRRFDGPTGGVVVTEQGKVWLGGSLAGDPPTPWLAGWDGERWADLDYSPGSARPGFTPMALGPGGEVWITVRPGHRVGDLMRYDGASLQSLEIPNLPAPGGAVGVLAIEAGPDGSLWVGGYLSSNWDEVILARFDGDAWSFHDWPTDHTDLPQLIFDLAAAPDGVLWAGGQTGLASFDGAEWTVHLEGVWVGSLDVAPDGTVWYSDEQGLHTLLLPRP